MTKTLCATFALSLLACAADDKTLPDGLVLDIEASNRVAGTYTSDGVTLAFDFARDVGADTHTSVLESADGEHLMTSVLLGSQEILNVLDGRLSLTGRPGSVDPEVKGDANAMHEMTERPDIKLLPDLRMALAERGIDDDLYAPDPKKNPEANVFNPYDGYWHLAPGESKQFATWSFWYPTYVYIRNFRSSCATYDMSAVGFGYVGPLRGYTLDQWTGYWWGMPLTIRQLNAYVYWDGYGVCVPGDIGAVAF